MQHLQAQGARLCVYSCPCRQLPGRPALALSPGGNVPTLLQMFVQKDRAKQCPTSPARKSPPTPLWRRRVTREWMELLARVLPTGTEGFCPQPPLWLRSPHTFPSPSHDFSFRAGGGPKISEPAPTPNTNLSLLPSPPHPRAFAQAVMGRFHQVLAVCPWTSHSLPGLRSSLVV